MGFRACLVCVFSTFVTWVMCTKSKQKDSLTAERIDNTNAVVGRLFVYSLRQGSENEGPFEVSDFLLSQVRQINRLNNRHFSCLSRCKINIS